MKKSINRNYFWADLFVNQLCEFGIKHICISPGSRNTPLTLAFAQNKKFKKYIHVDERSSGFFALGLAQSIKSPVVLLTTSGTAVAELFPSIIEAEIQRIPLIVCTADRPEYLRNTGANQTINQENIYSNHIKYFTDFGLPELNANKLNSFINKVCKGITIAIDKNPGPVHFNFPFRKPLEPGSFTDEISFTVSDFLRSSVIRKIKSKEIKNLYYKKLSNLFNKSQRPLIHMGWGNFDNEFYKNLITFSNNKKIPIFVDGTSELRFYNDRKNLIITNHSNFINDIEFLPDIIMQFGNTPTSQKMLNFFEEIKIKRILINQYGDIKDPSLNKGELIKVDPKTILEKLEDNLNIDCSDWSNYIIELENLCENHKNKIISKSRFGLEPRIINESLNFIPDKSNIIISNSMPIRDFDSFASKKKSGFQIFTNRGASGIDGIISTASGIGSQSKNNTYLIIGDLAFYHNISALSTLKELKIPLKIILINNNGGGIFNSLPVVNEKNFERYFITSQNLVFSKIVKAFGGNYYNPKSWISFNNYLIKSKYDAEFSVIELKTDAKESVELRKKYWAEVNHQINSHHVN
jgi:2-succinyl-5-enolpyruvyl-6-hydroxy-3-cyclohexene-1-carboxylate synthase